MTTFHEVRFPIDVAFGSTGGPERRTEIVSLGSGREQRNARWAHSRRRFNAGYGIRTQDDLSEVIAFFEERRGRLIGFRFRDPTDHRSCVPSAEPQPGDQAIGTGTGALAAFQLIKRYGGDDPYVRAITKPVAGSVRVAVNGVEAAPETWALDATTGVVTFADTAVPPAGAAVSAGYLFDCPVRFDSDALEINVSAFAAGAIPAVPLVEIIP